MRWLLNKMLRRWDVEMLRGRDGKYYSELRLGVGQGRSVLKL